MRKKEALQRAQKKLWNRLEDGTLVLPRGSVLVLTMPEDKVIATLTYMGKGHPDILVRDS